MTEAEVIREPDDEGIRTEAGERREEGFGTSAVARVAETSALVLAEQAKAKVQARYIVARKYPRDVGMARKRILADCNRPAFADSAIYNKPVGDGIEGPSIRMAEALARALGNIDTDVSTIYDDAEKRLIRVSATDLEANLTFPTDVTIVKTIERSRAMPGRKPLAMRKNNRGYDVFIYQALDDEIIDKEKALVSKALRTCLLRLVPGDMLEEAMEACYRVRSEEIKKDLPGRRRKLVDSFRQFNVEEKDIAEYLGHALSDTTADELAKLGSLWLAIRDKETTLAEVIDAKRGGAPAAAGGPPASSQDALGAKLEKKLAGAAKAKGATAEAAGGASAAQPASSTGSASVDEDGQPLFPAGK